MTPFRDALTYLSALVVTGVAHNYDVDAVPETLNRAQLPALLVLPGETQDNRLFVQRGEGFRSPAFSGGAKTATYAVTHLLLVAPVSIGRGARVHLPVLADLIDAYYAALKADVMLGGTLLEPARVEVEMGSFSRGGVTYHGCAFRHTWLIHV